jgi:hypothetical protein
MTQAVVLPMMSKLPLAEQRTPSVSQATIEDKIYQHPIHLSQFLFNRCLRDAEIDENEDASQRYGAKGQIKV